METFGQIVGFIFALFLLLLSYKFFKKEKYPTCTLLAILGSVALLCSFPWFQGWAKAYVNSILNSKLEALGEQVNNVQTSTTEMHKELEKHQTEIDNHQKELDQVQVKIRTAETSVFNQQSDITNQFRQISLLQTNLNIAETNITAQEKELSDVEYWVKNLYANTITETFSIKDTDHVLFYYSSNSVQRLYIRLTQVPIIGSVEEYLRDANSSGELRSYPGNFAKNLTECGIYGYDTNSLVVSFHYVADTRETNFYRQMPKLKDFIRLPNGSWMVPLLP